MTPTTAWFTVIQAAADLGVCAESIRRAIRRGDLPATRDGVHRGAPYLIAPADLDAYRRKRMRRGA